MIITTTNSVEGYKIVEYKGASVQEKWLQELIL